MPFRRFLPYDIVGAGLWGTTFVLLGYVFWQSFSTLVEYAKKGALRAGHGDRRCVVGAIWLALGPPAENRQGRVRWIDARPSGRRCGRWRGCSRRCAPRRAPRALRLGPPDARRARARADDAAGRRGRRGLRVRRPHGRARRRRVPSGDRDSLGVVDANCAPAARRRRQGRHAPGLAAGRGAAWWSSGCCCRGAACRGHRARRRDRADVRRRARRQGRARPPAPAGALVETDGSSFPSGHAAYAVTGRGRRGDRAACCRRGASRFALVVVALVLAAVVGLAASTCSAHYLSDVTGGLGPGRRGLRDCADGGAARRPSAPQCRVATPHEQRVGHLPRRGWLRRLRARRVRRADPRARVDVVQQGVGARRRDVPVALCARRFVVVGRPAAPAIVWFWDRIALAAKPSTTLAAAAPTMTGPCPSRRSDGGRARTRGLDAIAEAVEAGAGLPEVVRAAARALDASLVLIDRGGAVLAVAARSRPTSARCWPAARGSSAELRVADSSSGSCGCAARTEPGPGRCGSSGRSSPRRSSASAGRSARPSRRRGFVRASCAASRRRATARRRAAELGSTSRPARRVVVAAPTRSRRSRTAGAGASWRSPSAGRGPCGAAMPVGGATSPRRRGVVLLPGGDEATRGAAAESVCASSRPG